MHVLDVGFGYALDHLRGGDAPARHARSVTRASDTVVGSGPGRRHLIARVPAPRLMAARAWLCRQPGLPSATRLTASSRKAPLRRRSNCSRMMLLDLDGFKAVNSRWPARRD